jgi:hypothetical protein
MDKWTGGRGVLPRRVTELAGHILTQIGTPPSAALLHQQPRPAPDVVDDGP